MTDPQREWFAEWITQDLKDSKCHCGKPAAARDGRELLCSEHAKPRIKYGNDAPMQTLIFFRG